MNKVLTLFRINFCRNSKAPNRSKIRDYRTIHVLVTAFNHSITKGMLSFICFLGPGECIFISAFASIQFHGNVSIFEYAPFPVTLQNCVIILFLAILTTSSVGEASENLFHSIKGRGTSRRKIIVREIKALKPFGIQVGTVKVIERIVVLKIMHVIADTLTTALVTFPKEGVFP